MKFQIGDLVKKIKGSQWHGQVVGTYSTELTPEGYCVESSTEIGSVQIYPAAALEVWEGEERFRYYITDLHAGAIVGTNDKDVADSCALSEDHFVVDAQSGIWMTPYGEQEIKEARNETHT